MAVLVFSLASEGIENYISEIGFHNPKHLVRPQKNSPVV